MRVKCRLKEIMQQKGMKVNELRRRTGLGAEAIARLRGPHLRNVSLGVIAKICEALDVTLNDLFILYPDDIWAPIKLDREVTIHFGSRAFFEGGGRPPAGDDRPASDEWRPQYAGSWDLKAFGEITDYVKNKCPEANIRFEEHVTDQRATFDTSVRKAVVDVFKSGNHILLGSPTAHLFAEQVVCNAYGVASYSPHKRDAFPFGFVWNRNRYVVSSFGWEGMGEEFGIASTLTGKIVAPHTTVREGHGKDCALIVVHRVHRPQAARRDGSGDEGVIIALLGHTGVGTLAAARIAFDSAWAPALFPPERGKPHMRVVEVDYTRPPGSGSLDNREIAGLRLVPLPGDEPKAEGKNGRARRGKVSNASA